MKTFDVSERLAIEVVTDMEEPYLIIKDKFEEGGGDPLWILVWPYEFKPLVAALVEAAGELAEAEAERIAEELPTIRSTGTVAIVIPRRKR